MEPSNVPSGGAQNTLPKDTNPTNVNSTPPPAYTPRRQSDITSLANRVLQSQQQLANMLHPVRLDPALASLADQDAGDEDDSDESRSPISLRINTAINVSRQNNIVCINSSPSEQANAIARAVVQAIHDTSSGQCGIPMIDENGRPRPLRIEVEAGLVVEGSGNVVGERSLVTEILRRRAAEGSSSASRRRRDDDDDGEDADEGASPSKRRRVSQ